MSSKKISVALATYNAESYIDQQLESILKQSQKPDQIVVCDDNSHDSTKEILKHYKNRNLPCEFKLLRNKETKGITRTFERALSNTSGQLIAISDHDDVWAEEKLEKLASPFLKSSDVTLTYSKVDWYDADLRKKVYSTSRNVKNLADVLEGNIIAGHALMFHNSILDFLLPFPKNREYIRYDQWINLIACSKGNCRYVPAPLVKHRRHEDNATTQNIFLRDALRVFFSFNKEKIIENYKQNLRISQYTFKQFKLRMNKNLKESEKEKINNRVEESSFRLKVIKKGSFKKRVFYCAKVKKSSVLGFKNVFFSASPLIYHKIAELKNLFFGKVPRSTFQRIMILFKY